MIHVYMNIFYRDFEKITQVQNILTSDEGLEKMLSHLGSQCGDDAVKEDLIKVLIKYIDALLFNANRASQVNAFYTLQI